MERISETELNYALAVLRTQFRTSRYLGYTSRLEEKFCDLVQQPYAIALCNGTATMHSCLEALGIGIGDEVIVPPLTMASTSFAVLQTGATPVFADIDPDTFLLSIPSVLERLSPQTKAVIPVSIYGNPFDSKQLKAKLPPTVFILEDNAECLGSTIHGHAQGYFADASSYSFQSSKHLTSGEGGMIVTSSEELANKIRRVSGLGYKSLSSKVAKIDKATIQSPSYKRHDVLGWNYRISEICASVVCAQVERAQDLVATRIDSASRIINEVSSDRLQWQATLPHSSNSYWCLTALCESSEDLSRIYTKLATYTNDLPYGAWSLTYNEPAFKNMTLLTRERNLTKHGLSTWNAESCPVAESIQPRLLQFNTFYSSTDSLSSFIEALNISIHS